MTEVDCLTPDQRHVTAVSELKGDHQVKPSDLLWYTAECRSAITQWFRMTGRYSASAEVLGSKTAVQLVEVIQLQNPLSCTQLIGRLFMQLAKAQKANPLLRFNGN